MREAADRSPPWGRVESRVRSLVLIAADTIQAEGSYETSHEDGIPALETG